MSFFYENEQEKPKSVQLSPDSGKKEPKSDRKEYKNVSEISLDEEFSEIYGIAKDLLESVNDNDEVPANQRAQVLNSVTNMLQQIAKTRIDLHNSERLRRLEQVLLQVMRAQPEEVRQSFFESYSRALKEVDV